MAAMTSLLRRLVQREGADLIAYPIDVPHGLGEQALHTVGSGFSGLLSQLPAIFAFHATQNTLNKTQHPLKRFRPSKVGSQTSVQLEQGTVPPHHIGQGR